MGLGLGVGVGVGMRVRVRVEGGAARLRDACVPGEIYGEI